MMNKIKAFTLIETIFAIVIFCVGILVVLLWLSQTLRNQDYANTQIKSAFFAREWIELMFNLRDANYHKKLPWNCVFEWGKKLIGDWCKNVFSPSDLNILKVSIWSWDEYISIKNELSLMTLKKILKNSRFIFILELVIIDLAMIMIKIMVKKLDLQDM